MQQSKTFDAAKQLSDAEADSGGMAVANGAPKCEHRLAMGGRAEIAEGQEIGQGLPGGRTRTAARKAEADHGLSMDTVM
jgi:hypothetical protein